MKPVINKLKLIDVIKIVLTLVISNKMTGHQFDIKLHPEKSPARSMLFYSTNYWHQF